jgi:hypothetical protein
MMNIISSSTRTTTTTVTAIAVESALFLVGALVVVPLVDEAHALDLKGLKDHIKSVVQGVRDRIGSLGHGHPPG